MSFSRSSEKVVKMASLNRFFDEVGCHVTYPRCLSLIFAKHYTKSQKQNHDICHGFPGSRRKIWQTFQRQIWLKFCFFFADFGRGKDVMVCTNLASRGLDFSNAPRLLKVGNWWFRFVVEVGDVKRYPKKNRDHEILKWDPFFGGRNQTWFLKLVTVNFWRDFDFSSEQGA